MAEHWYGVTHEGQVIPVYTLPAVSSGQARSIRITDVRKAEKEGIDVLYEGKELNIKRLLPSVTTITGILAKPGLDNWKLDQIIKAAFQLDPQAIGHEGAYATIVKDKAFSTTRDAANFGTKIHKALEIILESGGGVEKVPVEYRAFLNPVLGLLKDLNLSDFKCETPVAEADIGYAGLVDIICKQGTRNIVLDFKTKKTVEGKPLFQAIEYKLQLAAYAQACFGDDLSNVTCYNIFISSTEPGRVDVLEIKDVPRHAAAFCNIARVFNYIRGI